MQFPLGYLILSSLDPSLFTVYCLLSLERETLLRKRPTMCTKEDEARRAAFRREIGAMARVRDAEQGRDEGQDDERRDNERQASGHSDEAARPDSCATIEPEAVLDDRVRTALQSARDARTRVTSEGEGEGEDTDASATASLTR